MNGHTDYGEYEFDHLPQNIQDYILEINNEIVSCFECQPRDNEEDEGIIWILGDRYEVEEYLSEKNIPEEYWDDIIPFMACPCCGQNFERYSEVGIMDKYETAYRARIDEIVKDAKPKIQDFYDFLSKYPYLGLKHEVGQQILNEITAMPLINISNEDYFRARKVDNGRVFVNEDMLNPPLTANVTEGRFNHYGQSHLYLGSTEEVCAKEISNHDKELLWIQKYKIKHLYAILDVSIYLDMDNINNIPLFFSGLFQTGIINVQKSKNISWTPEYFIPRFIADIAKLKGINGIKYNSAKCYGDNVVIFDTSKCEYEFIGDPYTITFNRSLYKEPLF
ncbi:MAG: hypothetical protein Ta2B_21920 [Termitinemataceae bacterium]|nr:MAG: hypothetical protein Ta2B_21920 [Termitinemataceae bacterium]